MRVHLYLTVKTLPLAESIGAMLGSAAPKSPYVTCPECGGTNVKKLTRLDGIDRISTVPWSRLQRFAGGGLYHCRLCRLQFYDCRRHTLNSKAAANAGH